MSTRKRSGFGIATIGCCHTSFLADMMMSPVSGTVDQGEDFIVD